MIDPTLLELFAAERTVRTTARALRARGDALLAPAAAAVDDAMGLEDKEEAALRLVRLADLLGDMEGPRAVDLLIRILGHDEPEARHAAGEALEGLAFDRFKEVALGIERALTSLPKGNVALTELPYLLAEVPEPGVMKLLGKFLGHPDADAVAAAIEALVEVGDASGASLLAPLVDDARHVEMEDEVGEGAQVSIGDLAREAREVLEDLGTKAGR